ncbi:MAG: hypothetical protein OYG31_01650 [Candidatus Kaiserbacteria bacterium]|nr:hypothetical protein [Candidatus Kaiserbacteria bacterium]
MRKRPIQKINDKGKIVKEYPSIREGADAEGVSPAVLYHYCCQSYGYKSLRGYTWRFTDGKKVKKVVSQNRKKHALEQRRVWLKKMRGA